MQGPLALDLNSRLFIGFVLIIAVMMLLPQTAHAAGSAMPWGSPANKNTTIH